MSIRQISLNNFRNLQPATLELHSKLNILYGSNASGKTSFLEALYVLCQGQSFKSSSLSQSIQHTKNSLLLFSYFNDYKVGISRSLKSLTIRLNGESIKKVSTLAEKTPVRIINANTLDLIVGTPSDKREFIDWCLFHVEHKYHQLWTDYNHAIKQRNALLKQKKNITQLDYWDQHLSILNNSIYKHRVEFHKTIKNILHTHFHDPIKDLNLDIIYKPGWDTEKLLNDVLQENRNLDLKYGFTRYGIHRDDIALSTCGLPVQQILSRGQIKTLSMLFVLAQIIYINQFTDKQTVLLIDDLESELDSDSVKYLLNKITNFNIQVFISLIKPSLDLFSNCQEYKMFHVEHGIIKPVKTS